MAAPSRLSRLLHRQDLKELDPTLIALVALNNVVGFGRNLNVC